jgi:hypothetical protein
MTSHRADAPDEARFARTCGRGTGGGRSSTVEGAVEEMMKQGPAQRQETRSWCVRPASRVVEDQRGNERRNDKERAWVGDARLGFDQRKVGDEVGRGATMLSKARRHSAFLVSSVDGSSAGQIVVASAWTTVPAIAQTQSREGPPREKACGLPRERTGCTEQRWSWPWYLR